MNTYYLVPAIEYENPVLRNINRSDFDSTTERIVNNPYLDEYQRGVALQGALTKYLNKGKKSDEKDDIKALLKDVLKEGAESAPAKPSLKSILKTPKKAVRIQEDDDDSDDFASARSKLQFHDAEHEDDLDGAPQGTPAPIATPRFSASSSGPKQNPTPRLSAQFHTAPKQNLLSPAEVEGALQPRKSGRNTKAPNRLAYEKKGGWVPHN